MTTAPITTCAPTARDLLVALGGADHALHTVVDGVVLPTSARSSAAILCSCGARFEAPVGLAVVRWADHPIPWRSFARDALRNVPVAS